MAVVPAEFGAIWSQRLSFPEKPPGRVNGWLGALSKVNLSRLSPAKLNQALLTKPHQLGRWCVSARTKRPHATCWCRFNCEFLDKSVADYDPFGPADKAVKERLGKVARQ